ncbi:toll/interleukin-1 receptor domain-containing protein [Acetobacter peroxydans]|uniref:TIR domain-containing protein n=1 Tax=Acetobacter peroxydans TaxID=104098 RepID=A0A4Y3TZT7_9PROT|nr:toll/interleukin-1 receptor domain-containing protein [Acetobacter peroxydans]NHO17166.1 TIR domain-containing protein [Acetobacter peroxydans]GBR35616.1 hypothetical protein AA13755_1281 [Acetobacter peroxydans NBRC 13755]GBR39426.1 hypothetical protein AA0475_0183 [Acetobacter peroxydans]GEB86215.1 hypothetical protein APE01nite_20120 [Acetobacter peroxydans]
MSYFTLDEVRRAFQNAQVKNAQAKNALREIAMESLNEEAAAVRDSDNFDIFLSHSLMDADVVAGVKSILESQGHTVYVDWIVDGQLDRHAVTPKTADILRQRMRQSESMIFATSESSSKSRWMPWELGYFDGLRQGRIAILPLVASSGATFEGQEYLGLYPLIELLPVAQGVKRAFVTKGATSREYLPITDFQKGVTAFKTR